MTRVSTGRAQTESWTGSYDQALQTYDRLRAIAPNDASVRYEQARVLAWANRYQAATVQYDSLLKSNPRDVPALQGLARLTAWAGDLIGAEELWRRALAIDARNAITLNGLAQTLRWQGRDAAALELLQRTLVIVPADKDAREQMKWVLAAIAPRVSPSYVREDDSDGNSVGSTRVAAAWRPASRTEVRAEGYLRSAHLDEFVVSDQGSSGGSVGVWQQFEPGWSVFAAAGASQADAPDSPTFASARAVLATPTDRSLRVGDAPFRQAAHARNRGPQLRVCS